MTTPIVSDLATSSDRTSAHEKQDDLPTQSESEAVTTIRYSQTSDPFVFGFSLPGTDGIKPAAYTGISPFAFHSAFDVDLSAQGDTGHFVSVSRERPVRHADVMLPEDFDVDSHTANLLDKNAWLRPPETGAYMGTFLRRGFGLPAPNSPYGHRRSFAEAAFYYYLKLLFADTRDSAFGIAGRNVELDIVIPSQRIALEFDDPIREKHATLAEDIEKYAACRNHGIYLIRVKEMRTLGDEESADLIYSIPDILKPKNLQTVIQKIIDALDPDCDCWNRSAARIPTSRVQVGLRRDKGKIEAFTMKLQGTSLAYRHPELIGEWHKAKNAAIYPEMFTPESRERVWWHCLLCESDYERPIADRVDGIACPRCMKKTMNPKRLNATKIVQYSLDGQRIQIWESVSSAAKHIGVSASNISLCANGKRNHAGGFIWRREGDPL